MEKFTEWVDKNWEKGNLCAPELEPQKAIYFLVDYLLGEDWYTSAIGNVKQINVDIVAAILEKHSMKYRRELRKYKKSVKK